MATDNELEVLIIDRWEYEDRNVGLGLIFGDRQFLSINSLRSDGYFINLDGTVKKGSIDEYKGAIDVFCNSDEGNSKFFAGKPLGSGIIHAKCIASNSTIFEIYEPIDTLPLLFCKSPTLDYKVLQVHIATKILRASNSPYFSCYQIISNSMFKQHMTNFRKMMGMPQGEIEDKPINDGQLSDGDWINFNRLWNGSYWEHSYGAFTINSLGQTKLICKCNVEIGAWLSLESVSMIVTSLLLEKLHLAFIQYHRYSMVALLDRGWHCLNFNRVAAFACKRGCAARVATVARQPWWLSHKSFNATSSQPGTAYEP